MSIKKVREELRRRSIWQVVLGYAAAVVGVLGIADLTIKILDLPDWVLQAAFLMCLMALPVVLATALVQKTGLKDDLPSEVAPATGLRRWLTWRTAVIVVASSLGLLGVATTSFMWIRSQGIDPSGPFSDRDQVGELAVLVLSDFGGPTENASFVGTFQQEVRNAFQDFRPITLAGHMQVDSILKRMKRPVDSRLDPELAREVAVRGGFAGVIEGDLTRRGDRFHLRAHLVSAGSGEVLLTRGDSSSADPEEVLATILELSTNLRQGIAESLSSVPKAQPLPPVTTYSLEALQTYAASFEAPGLEEGLALLEEAVALDSTFAMAWRRLGALLERAHADPTGRLEALTSAFNNRGGLTSRERYLVEGSYFIGIGEHRDGIRAYETYLRLFPDDSDFNDLAVRTNLAVHYRAQGREDRAEAILLEALKRHAPHCAVAADLSIARLNQGKVDEAEAALQEFCDDPSNQRVREIQAAVAVARGEYATAGDQFRWMLDNGADNASFRGFALRGLMALSAVQGRLSEAEAYAREAMAVPLEESPHIDYWFVHWDWAALQLWVRTDTLAALEVLDSALSPFQAEEIGAQDQPEFLKWAAKLYAEAGQIEQAREILFQLEDGGNSGVPAAAGPLNDLTAVLALAEGRYDDALAELRGPYASSEWTSLPYLARTYEALAQADSALAVYERYVTTPHYFRLFVFDQLFMGHALERAAQLYDQRGGREKAAEYYGRFVELWAEADPESQPRVEAARQRLQELGGG